MTKENWKSIINLVSMVLSAIAAAISTSACVPKLPDFINYLNF